MIVGARMNEEGRQYQVQWTAEHHEYPDEPWQSWVNYGAIFPEGAVNTQLEKMIEEIDMVTSGECAHQAMLSASHARAQPALPCL